MLPDVHHMSLSPDGVWVVVWAPDSDAVVTGLVSWKGAGCVLHGTKPLLNVSWNQSPIFAAL